jgi:hypothetical protein
MKYWYVCFKVKYSSYEVEYSSVVAGESFDAVTQHVIHGKTERGLQTEWSGRIIFAHEISKEEYDRLYENIN